MKIEGINMCSVCGYQISNIEAAECYKKKIPFICSDCTWEKKAKK